MKQSEEAIIMSCWSASVQLTWDNDPKLLLTHYPHSSTLVRSPIFHPWVAVMSLQCFFILSLKTSSLDELSTSTGFHWNFAYFGFVNAFLRKNAFLL